MKSPFGNSTSVGVAVIVVAVAIGVSFNRSPKLVTAAADISPDGSIYFGSADRDDSVVHVWDNVVKNSNRNALYHFALDHCEEGELYRPNSNKPPASPIEALLDQILGDLNDKSPYVEYWCRHEWQHVEVHSDIDESSLEENGEIRFPNNGHVLYLQVGSVIHGPTIVLENYSSGGSLVDESNKDKEISLIAIPSVEGRLTRFPGSWLHGVPRPTDVWLTGHPKDEDDLDIGPLEKFGRSVLLFNTWTEPPLDMPPPSKKKCFKGYCGGYDKNKTKCLAAPYQDWKELHVVPSPSVGKSSTTLPNPARVELYLMGSPKRMNHTEDSVQVLSNEVELRGMLFDPKQPRSMPLWQYHHDHHHNAENDGGEDIPIMDH